MRDPGLTWAEKLLIGEYTDEGTAIEAMRGFMRLGQAKNENLGELRGTSNKIVSLGLT